MKTKRLSAIVFVLLALTVLFSVAACAADDVLTYDIFTYTVKNNQATIKSIDATDLKRVYIPSEIDGNTVGMIDHSVKIRASSAFELYIPETVFDMYRLVSSDREKYSQVSKFVVDEKNEYYSSDDYGALYDKGKETLLIFPQQSTAKEYTAPSTLVEIHDYAFNYCKKLETVTLNDGIKRITRFAFYEATKLKSINFPEGLEYIGEDAFIRCYSLEEAVLPDSVTTLCNSAFSECTSLKEFVFPENITAIMVFVLADDTALERVVIPAGVTSVWNDAFYDCPKLKHIYFKGTEEQWNAIPNIGTAYGIADAAIHFNYEPSDAFDGIDFNLQNGILYVSGADTLPDTKKSNLFFFEESCDEVTTIILDGVKYIGDYAFDNYPGLVNLIVSGADVQISDSAFANCPGLETVIFFGGADFDPSAFEDCSDNIRIFANDLYAHTSAEGVIPFVFSDGVLDFQGEVKLNRYEFFDTVAAFCLEYDNIGKLKFERLTFEDIGLYYYPDEESEPVLIEGNTLDEGEITVYITADGENKEISFNALIAGIEDESITNFSLAATDKTHGQTKDTVFNIIKKAVLRALKWVVGLMNKVFNLIGKK